MEKLEREQKAHEESGTLDYEKRYAEIISFEVPSDFEGRSFNIKLKDNRVFSIHLPPEGKPGDLVQTKVQDDGKDLLLLTKAERGKEELTISGVGLVSGGLIIGTLEKGEPSGPTTPAVLSFANTQENLSAIEKITQSAKNAVADAKIGLESAGHQIYEKSSELFHKAEEALHSHQEHAKKEEPISAYAKPSTDTTSSMTDDPNLKPDKWTARPLEDEKQQPTFTDRIQQGAEKAGHKISEASHKLYTSTADALNMPQAKKEEDKTMGDKAKEIGDDAQDRAEGAKKEAKDLGQQIEDTYDKWRLNISDDKKKDDRTWGEAAKEHGDKAQEQVEAAQKKASDELDKFRKEEDKLPPEKTMSEKLNEGVESAKQHVSEFYNKAFAKHEPKTWGDEAKQAVETAQDNIEATKQKAEEGAKDMYDSTFGKEKEKLPEKSTAEKVKENVEHAGEEIREKGEEWYNKLKNTVVPDEETKNKNKTWGDHAKETVDNAEKQIKDTEKKVEDSSKDLKDRALGQGKYKSWGETAKEVGDSAQEKFESASETAHKAFEHDKTVGDKAKEKIDKIEEDQENASSENIKQNVNKDEHSKESQGFFNQVWTKAKDAMASPKPPTEVEHVQKLN